MDVCSLFRTCIMEYGTQFHFILLYISSMNTRHLNSTWRRSLNAELSGQGSVQAPTFPKMMAAAYLVSKLPVEETFMKLNRTRGNVDLVASLLARRLPLKYTAERKYLKQETRFKCCDCLYTICTCQNS